MTRRLTLCILLAPTLLACGDPPYKGDAKITGHEYDNPTSPGYMGHDPEHFLLHVEWVDEDGKRHTDVREAPKSAYDGCPDGRTINLESMTCPMR